MALLELNWAEDRGWMCMRANNTNCYNFSSVINFTMICCQQLACEYILHFDELLLHFGWSRCVVLIKWLAILRPLFLGWSMPGQPL